LQYGETANTEIVTSLLTNLRDRGLVATKALAAGVKRVFGTNAVIQRCQEHKARNVEGHVAKKHPPEVRRRLNEAYAQLN
jgi:putative transposase